MHVYVFTHVYVSPSTTQPHLNRSLAHSIHFTQLAHSRTQINHTTYPQVVSDALEEFETVAYTFVDIDTASESEIAELVAAASNLCSALKTIA